MLLRSTAALLTVLLPAALTAEEEPMASGISLSYIALVAGSVDAGPLSADWDEGLRFELQFRDYYFPQQAHHPFYEIGLILERQRANDDDTEIEAETLALKGAIGSAVPLWISSDSALGVAPLLSMHVGRMTFDVDRADGTSSDDALRAGLSLGCDGWAVLDRTTTIGVGPFLSYWRSQNLEVATAGGAEGVNPSGWDVGIRLLVGMVF